MTKKWTILRYELNCYNTSLKNININTILQVVPFIGLDLKDEFQIHTKWLVVQYCTCIQPRTAPGFSVWFNINLSLSHKINQISHYFLSNHFKRFYGLISYVNKTSIIYNIPSHPPPPFVHQISVHPNKAFDGYTEI